MSRECHDKSKICCLTLFTRFPSYAFITFVSLLFLYTIICMSKCNETFAVTLLKHKLLAVILLECLEHLCYMLINSPLIINK